MEDRCVTCLSFAGFCLSAMLLLSGCESAPSVLAAKPVSQMTSLDASKMVWKHVSSQDYETKQPGAGYSRKYKNEYGWADVYTYDSGYSEWLDDLKDPRLPRVFDSVLGEVNKVFSKEGPLVLKEKDTVPLGGRQFLHAVYSVNLGGRAAESHVYLTVLRRHLLKIRMTFWEPGPVGLQSSIAKFVESQIDFTLKDATLARAIARDKVIGISIDQKAIEAEDATVWIGYILARAKYRQEHDIAIEQSQGVLAPSFAEELEARKTAVQIYRELREKTPEMKISYWEALAKVEAAGFLPQYIWHNHHVPEWTEAPSGVETFIAWSLEHLKSHKPETQGTLVVANKKDTKGIKE